MAEAFDPYHKWLGIPPAEQPPHHYRLLGLEPFEADVDVIASSADRHMAHLRTFQTSKHVYESQQLLNQVAAARICLLHAERKRAYDEQLRQALCETSPATSPASSAFPATPSEPLETAPLPFESNRDSLPDEPSSPVDASASVSRRRRLNPAIAATAAILIWVAAFIKLTRTDDSEALATNDPRNIPIPAPAQKIADVPLSSPPPDERASNPNNLAAVQQPDTTPPVTTPPVVPPAVVPQPPLDPGPQPGLNLAPDEELDLLQMIDVKRDSRSWTTGLVNLTDPPSDDYSMTVVFGSGAGDPKDCHLGLIAGGQQFMVSLNRESVVSSSGLHLLDGQVPAYNETNCPGLALSRNPVTIVCTVRKNWITVVADGNRIVDWTGDTKRLSMPFVLGTDPQRLFLLPNSPVFISKLTIKRLANSAGPGDAIAPGGRSIKPGQDIDVLPLLDLQRDIVAGEWTLEAGVLTAGTKDAQIYIPTEPTRDFRLTVHLTRPAGSSETFKALVPIGSQHATVNSGNRIGVLHAGNLVILPEKAYEIQPVLSIDRPHTLEYQVAGEHLKFSVDQKLIFDWKHEERRIYPERVGHLPKDRIVLKMQPGFRVDRLTFQSLGKIVVDPLARAPEPDVATRTKARAELRAAFAEEFANAKGSKTQEQLAQALLANTLLLKNDPAALYATITEAHALAVSSGQVELAMSAIDELAAAFIINAFDWKVRSLAQLADQVHDTTQRTALVNQLLEAVNEAVVADNLKLALQLCAQAQLAATKVSNVELRKRVIARLSELKRMAGGAK